MLLVGLHRATANDSTPKLRRKRSRQCGAQSAVLLQLDLHVRSMHLVAMRPTSLTSCTTQLGENVDDSDSRTVNCM
jgi:hypothetical protein